MTKTMRYGILLGLLAGFAPACHADNLNWGSLFVKGATVSPTTQNYLTGIMTETRSNSGIHFTAVAHIIAQGHLPTDPGYQECRLVLQTVPMILKLAICARAAGDPSQAAACRGAATTGLKVWANTYKPNGDPINETVFIPWAQAMDIMTPLLAPKDLAPLQKFARALIAGGDKFYGGMSTKDGRYYNNWGTFRLCERAYFAAALGDKAALQATGKMLDAHLPHNIYTDGSTLDYLQRDAFDYHLYDLKPLMGVAAQMPKGFMSAASMARIQKSLDFMRPYFLGQKTHIEFLHTTVAIDLARKKAGLAAYQNKPWVPSTARPVLRVGRVAFPAIKSWTASIVDDKYDTILRLMVSAIEDRP